MPPVRMPGGTEPVKKVWITMTSSMSPKYTGMSDQPTLCDPGSSCTASDASRTACSHPLYRQAASHPGAPLFEELIVIPPRWEASSSAASLLASWEAPACSPSAAAASLRAHSARLQSSLEASLAPAGEPCS